MQIELAQNSYIKRNSNGRIFLDTGFRFQELIKKIDNTEKILAYIMLCDEAIKSQDLTINQSNAVQLLDPVPCKKYYAKIILELMVDFHLFETVSPDGGFDD